MLESRNANVPELPAPVAAVSDEEARDVHHRFPCQQCGSTLVFGPETRSLNCPYCGGRSEVPESAETIHEYGYRETLAGLERGENTEESITSTCQNCAAEITLGDGVHAGDCPFCGTPIVAGTTRHRQIKARALLPFQVAERDAKKRFQRWIKSLWFAPNDVKKYAEDDDKLAGIYVPYWTYDSRTTSAYRGQRGDVYYVQQTYRVMVDGRTVTRTRSVPKIRWTPVSGVVSRYFDDVLVLASNTLPRRITEGLEPWDVSNLVPYQEEYLSGFRGEMYQVDLKEGFGHARRIMAETIDIDVRRDIGGDQQRIAAIDTRHSDIRFKHILLPVWLASFRFRNKTYRFVVNGRTGKVQGERPWSYWKIAAAAIAAIVLAVLLVAVMGEAQMQGYNYY